MTTNTQSESPDKASVRLVEIKALKAQIHKLEDLDEAHKRNLEHRWLHMVRWWDQRSTESKWKYLLFRTTVLLGGVLVPALVSLQTSSLFVGYTAWIQLATIAVGLLIAISAGAEEIWHFGDIWREKRNAAEHLKIEGWRYLQLVGPYRKNDHNAAYPEFAANVELMIEREIKDYFAAAKPEEKGEIQKLIDESIKKHLKP